MNPSVWMLLGACCAWPMAASAHLSGAHDTATTPVYDKTVQPPQLAQGPAAAAHEAPPAAPTVSALPAAVFAPFAPAVRFRVDDQFFYIASNGMPDHRMMVGITAWQQQVALPQAYTDGNAWRVPLKPVPAAHPLSAKTHFFRGAIAIAANGVPVFNPIKNDGITDTLLAGELDEFGGHAGRADDYHYHTAPIHLQSAVGAGLPVAYALDGYAIYGLTEPDGSAPVGLDHFNGHTTPALGYHYHATKTYPYLNGGFHGEVTEREGQVDPQPRAEGLRPALTPWPGARIVGATQKSANEHSLRVVAEGQTHLIHYRIDDDGSVRFEFIAPDGSSRVETHNPRPRGGAGAAGKHLAEPAPIEPTMPLQR